MASDNQQAIEQVKGSIRQMLQRVPQRVLAGGLQTSKAYKESVEFANKYLKSARPSLEKLQQAYQRLAAYQ